MKPSRLLRSVALVTLLSLPALSLSASLSGCKDKGSATTPAQSERAAAAAPRQAADDGERTGANLTPTRKGTGEGWRWKGKREACMFLVGKQCFDKREAACSSAGCPGDTCKTTSAVPAQVSCKGAN